MPEKLKIREGLEVSKEEIETFCNKWGVTELELFGSVLRDDFSPEESDIDFLFTYDSKLRQLSLFDLVTMKEELEAICGRKVDLISKRGVERQRNELRRKEILKSTRLFYAKAS